MIYHLTGFSYTTKAQDWGVFILALGTLVTALVNLIIAIDHHRERKAERKMDNKDDKG